MSSDDHAERDDLTPDEEQPEAAPTPLPGTIIRYGGIDPDAVFDEVVEALTRPAEGGYVSPEEAERRGDAGGETNFGISKRRFPKVNIKALTWPKAKALYKREFWEKPGLDKVAMISPSLAMALFDYGLHSGITFDDPNGPHAAYEFQKLVGAEVDGIIGPKTLEATKAYVVLAAALDLVDMRERFLVHLTETSERHRRNRLGFINRMNRVRRFLRDESARRGRHTRDRESSGDGAPSQGVEGGDAGEETS